MNDNLSAQSDGVRDRALVTGGTSGEAIYHAVAAELRRRNVAGATLYDIGCGTGALASYVAPLVAKYVGVDVVRYENFPQGLEFLQANLDETPWPLAEASADVVTSVETIEHLENPRLHVRQLGRLAKPGGIVVATTPNNLSWLSILTLLRKGVFNAFQVGPGLYPAHITALTETDLLRIAQECGLVETTISFTNRGRVPFSARHWPSAFRGRRFSDNIILGTRRPASAS